MKVWAVTVFESGDFSTSVWGVYDSEAKANAYKEELLASDLNKGDYYLDVAVTGHEVNLPELEGISCRNLMAFLML